MTLGLYVRTESGAGMLRQRTSVQLLEQLQKNTENIRNVCILAHVDHGKSDENDIKSVEHPVQDHEIIYLTAELVEE